MANSKMVFYPVGNGDMTLLKLNDSNSTTILIDMNVRNASHDDGQDEYYDVMSHLKSNLKKNSLGRYYVDAFILTHGDADHISGLENNFYLGDIDRYSNKDKENEKIIINEMWSSCRFCKRKSNDNTLSNDARAFNKEMKRRVKLFKDSQSIQKEGNRARIIGSDHNNTETVKGIVSELEDNIKYINNRYLSDFKIIPLGPLDQQETEDDDDFNNNKNRGSLVLQLTVSQNSRENKILLTGDAEASIWEYNEELYDSDLLEYDILHLPHHCSFYSIGTKNKDGDYIVLDNAFNALSHAKNKDTAIIISSSVEIVDDDKNPPHYKAKQEYLKIINNKKNFYCTEEHLEDKKLAPIEIELTSAGTQKVAGPSISKVSTASTVSSGKAYEHGYRFKY